ncbi:TetR/AcrR family transcriptional regulator [Williamsia serinedens]|uniref:TetR/AcrR family transcriptional regulator n=1 Tax=Williamsia serinedens TaxID=391736 RepID=UPI0020A269DA|nr:TetR/AcrR family transcriptional regulator [Williamsia serinedens]
MSIVVADQSLRRGRAREDILARVWELIADGGVGAFSIRDAAAVAGVSSGTITYHFASRERLVDEAFAALAERYETIGRVAITSSRSGTRDEASATLVYALHHLWGERTITLAAAELRVHATRSRAARGSAESISGICRSVVGELHRVTDRVGTTPRQAVDLLDVAAIRLAVRHQSADNFRVAIRRHVNSLYVHS